MSEKKQMTAPSESELLRNLHLDGESLIGKVLLGNLRTIDTLKSLLGVAVTSECTNFDLPEDWIHRASKAIGSPVGMYFAPKRMSPSQARALVLALEELYRDWLTLSRSGDGCELGRKVRAALKSSRGDL